MTRPGPKGIDWRAVFHAASPDGLCAAEIARRTGVTHSSVQYAAQRWGASLPKGRGGRLRKMTADLDAAFLRAAAAKQMPSRFCIEQEICSNTLKKLEARHGVKLPRKTGSHRGWSP